MTNPTYNAQELLELLADIVQIGFFVTIGIALKRWLDRQAG